MMTGEKARARRKERIGTVVSDRMDKTIIVNVKRTLRHPLYGKVIKRDSRFYVHDEESKANRGDKVRIVETRPLSKTKRWRLVEVMTTMPSQGDE